MYNIIRSEPGLYTVGTGSPQKKDWNPISDHESMQEAENKVRYLNGGGAGANEVKDVRLELGEAFQRIEALEKNLKAFMWDFRWLQNAFQKVGRNYADLLRKLDTLGES